VEDIKRYVREVVKRRRRRNLIGAILISTSLMEMELAILILLGVIAVNPMVAVTLIAISPISMAVGLYLLLTQPPIVLE